MNINFTLCGTVCEKVSFPTTLGCHKRTKPSNKVKYIINDLNILISDSDVDPRYICTHILNKVVQMTNSEYGFIGKVLYKNDIPVLHTYAITNIAWNEASHDFFLDHINECMCFRNMETLFGSVITDKRIKIVNKYNRTRAILPKGHPLVKRFLGIPVIFGNKVICMIGICNKIKPFTKKDARNVNFIMTMMAYLFIDLSKSMKETEEKIIDSIEKP